MGYLPPHHAASGHAGPVDVAPGLDSDRAVERSSTLTGPGGAWTVEFEVHCLTGAAGERLAARQADVIAALLSWVGSQASDGAREAA